MDIPDGFSDLVRAAELSASLSCRLIAGHALANVLVSECRKMVVDLLLEPPVAPAPAEMSKNPTSEPVEPHRQLPGAQARHEDPSSSRVTNATVLAQVFVSTDSWRRPVRVIS